MTSERGPRPSTVSGRGDSPGSGQRGDRRPSTSSGEAEPRWHAALAYAVVGQIPEGITETGGVDLEVLLAQLAASRPGGLEAITHELRERKVRRLPAHQIPEDLRSGLPAAQLAAALTALQSRLGVGPTGRVAAARPLNADERRLQAEVPPHHGV